MVSILERCVIPRLKLSAVDAVFCAKFMELFKPYMDEALFNLVLFIQRLAITVGCLLKYTI